MSQKRRFIRVSFLPLPFTSKYFNPSRCASLVPALGAHIEVKMAMQYITSSNRWRQNTEMKYIKSLKITWVLQLLVV